MKTNTTNVKRLKKDNEKGLPEIKNESRLPSSSRFNNRTITSRKIDESIYNIVVRDDHSKTNINNHIKNKESKKPNINLENNLKSQSALQNTNNPNLISKATDFINSVIHEYLLKKEYFKTLELFQIEVEEKLRSKAYYLTSFTKEYSDKLLIKNFANGNKIEFFKLFNFLFPVHVRKREESIKILEFQLQIFFTIFPISNHFEFLNNNNFKVNNNNKNEHSIKKREEYLLRIDEFKRYLDQIQGTFKTNEMLSYFALPYITNPETNPAFEHIFEARWAHQLKNNLLESIKTFVPLGVKPILYEVFSVYTQTVDNSKNIVINQINNLAYDKEGDIEKMNQMTNELNNLKQKEEQLRETLMQSQIKWTKLAIEINTIGAEILNALKNIKQKPVNNNFIETKTLKLNKFDFFLKKNLSEFEIGLEKINSKNPNNINTKNNSDSILWGNQINNSNLLLANQINHVNKNSLTNLKQSSKFMNKSLNHSDQLLNSSQAQGPNYNIVDYGSNILHENTILNESNEFNLKNNDSINNNNNDSHIILESMNMNSNNKNNNMSIIQQKINEKEAQFNSKYLLDISLIKEEIGKLGSVTRNSKDWYNKISFILKELRFRLSKKRHSSIKQQTLLSILHYDLFALKSKRVNLLNQLLDNNVTLEETLKLINLIASTAIGRDYILNRENIVEEVTKVLKSEENDSTIRKNCLGILQKFSLRPIPQKKLIDLDLLGWCMSTIITEQISLSDYTLEYCLAMIMNLSLNVKGREKCVNHFSTFLKIINTYISTSNIHIRTCLNGTLYSLLKIKACKEEAKIKGLEKLLKDKLLDPNENFKKQIEYIVEELNKDEEPTSNNQVDCEFNDDWGSDFVDEMYEDDCNLNETISEVAFLKINLNNNEEIKHLHNKAVEYFILKFETDNIEEIKKLNEYSNSLLKKRYKKSNSKGFSIEEFTRPLSRPITPMQHRESIGDSTMSKKIVTKEKFSDNEKKVFKNKNKDEEHEDFLSKDSRDQNFNNKGKNNNLAIEENESLKDDIDGSIKSEVLKELENKASSQTKPGYTYDFTKKDDDLQKDTKAFKTKHKINRTPDQTEYP